jgi:hypothetical protein
MPRPSRQPAGVRWQPLPWSCKGERDPATKARSDSHILAPYAHASTRWSKRGPWLSLPSILHARRGAPLDASIEQNGAQGANKSGLHPCSTSPCPKARAPLGTPTEQKKPQHTTNAAKDKKTSTAHRVLAFFHPHGKAPCRLSSLPPRCAHLWASGSCFLTWALLPSLGSGLFRPAHPCLPPDAE